MLFLIPTLIVLAWPGVVLHGAEPKRQAVSREYDPSIDGCGKAHAWKRGWDEQQAPRSDGAAAEAMNDTDVLHYDLDIEITNLNPAANSCTITGTNTLTVQSKSAALTVFTIRLRSQFTISSALVNGNSVSVSNDSVSTRTVTLDRAYGMDEVFTLEIAYTGNTQSVGLGSFEVDSHAGIPVVATLSEPYYSYSWWPVKDGDVLMPGDNSDKATVDLTVTVPNNFSVAANGSVQTVEVLSGNRKRTHWATQYPMATYLVAFGATNYTTWTQTYTFPGGTMPVEFYIYPENDNITNRGSWEKVLNILPVFRSLFGEYPFINEKYGIYNFPFGGGMEHQTMTGQSSFGENLTVHELAHQWWGDAVTCKTWCDIWLNEGFATYSEALWLERKFGAPNPVALYNAMQARKPATVNGSVYIPPDQTDDANRIFDGSLSYRKGAWVLHQLRHIVGDAAFFQILADYRNAFEGAAPTTDDFAAVASSTHGQDLTWFFDQCVYAVGAPAYTFGADWIEIEGTRYLHIQIKQTQAPPYPNVYTFPVDIVASIGTTGPKETVTVWNDERSQRFVRPIAIEPTLVRFDPDEWILRTAAASVSFMIGDMDADLDVDTDDYDAFAACYSWPDVPFAEGCQPADMDGDGDVDCRDWSGFTTTWTAGGSPPQFPTCINGKVPATSTWGLIVLSLLVLCAGTILCSRRAAVISGN